MYVNPLYIQDFIDNTPNLYDFFYKINIIKLNPAEKTFVEFVLEKTIDEFSKTPEHNNTVIKSYISTLFLTLSDCVKNSKENINNNSQNISDSMREIIDYINVNFSNEITLNILAKEFYLHPSYISNMIKKNLGVTFVDYLNRIRVQKSVKLLLTTDYKIEDISAICGFNSSSRYCKTFASYFSISPTKYRKLKKISETDFS